MQQPSSLHPENLIGGGPDPGHKQAWSTYPQFKGRGLTTQIFSTRKIYNTLLSTHLYNICQVDWQQSGVIPPHPRVVLGGLCQPRSWCTCNIRENLFAERVINIWNSMPSTIDQLWISRY